MQSCDFLPRAHRWHSCGAERSRSGNAMLPFKTARVALPRASFDHRLPPWNVTGHIPNHRDCGSNVRAHAFSRHARKSSRLADKGGYRYVEAEAAT